MAWMAAAAMLFASAGPIVSSHAAVDADCAPVIAQRHDHTAHQIRATPEEAPDHCAACHLTRTVRGASGAQRFAWAGVFRQAAPALEQDAILRVTRRTDFTRGPPPSLA